jgi:hypothetical protein
VFLAADSLGLTAAASPRQDVDASNDLGLVGTPDSSGTEFDRPSGGGLFQQSVTFWIADPCHEKQYAPAIGEGPSGYDAVPAAMPTLTATGQVVLSYPVSSPTTTLTLKAPEFGDTDSVGLTRIDRQTRGGTAVVFSDQKWATSNALGLEFSRICDPPIADVLDFLNATVGAEISLVDWYGRTWHGVIVSPETDVRQQSGGYGLRLTFEGEIQ